MPSAKYGFENVQSNPAITNQNKLTSKLCERKIRRDSRRKEEKLVHIAIDGQRLFSKKTNGNNNTYTST